MPIQLNDKDLEELAQVAYEAYGDYREWKVFSGDAMPTWQEQHEDLKEAWICAVHHVAVAIALKNE